MKKIVIETKVKRMLADVYTPVGIYLRVRDRFRDTILLESTDYYLAENSYSFICINAVAGMEITSTKSIEFKLPGQKPERSDIHNVQEVPQQLWNFMQNFEVSSPAADKDAFAAEKQHAAKNAQGLFGYATYDAVQFFDTIKFAPRNSHPINGQEGKAVSGDAIPLMRYRFYQYVIVINHFKDELFLCENVISGLDSDVLIVESLIRSKDVPVFPFAKRGEETSNMKDEDYVEMVKKGIQSCNRGDVFQIVLSRRFQQKFTGDEFNVYRALRNVNPSPYLFFFDYGDYKLMGSSPESQLVIQDGKAVVHPIAGTFKRTGDEKTDHEAAERLLKDPKENAEHVMLVDLARNDLSRICDEVVVSQYKKVQYYSHVIHLVSEVTAHVKKGTNPFLLLAKTFPAGTLSGAPKFKAMQLIDGNEPTARSYYGGALGFMGFDGSCNHAIMIRTFLSKDNTLTYQAGAGIVTASNPKSELQEVKNKLGALKKAIDLAEEEA
jgi:anthranilate synthase component 1